MAKEKKETSKKINKKDDNKKDDNNKKVSNKKKESIFIKIGRYFRGVWKEIKRIRWTNSKDLLKYSVATLIFVLFFGIYFYAIDWIVLLVRSLVK